MKTVSNRPEIIKDRHREDKENQPTNALGKLRKGIKESANSKIGQQIKSKIKRMSEQGLTLRNDFQNLPQAETSLNKSVSFGNEEPPLLRHTSSTRSILKNSLTKSSASLKKSQVSIANSHACSQQQSTEHSGGNKVVLEKYQRFVKDAKQSGRKFRDDIYPPVRSSIHLHNSLMGSFCQMFQKQGRTVEWLRLGEIFGSRHLTLWASDPSQKNLIGNGPLSRNWEYFPIALNLIRQKNSILQRFFEDQHVNQNGIYRVKIYMTQQNIWKYVIIDDYVPVIVNNKLNLSNRYLPENIHPAFLTVMTPQADSPIQIWPFLLQKAYAKYYSTYDGLANGSAYDFVEELTGTFLSTINIHENRERVKEILRNDDAMIMAEDSKGSYFPIRLLNSQKNTIAFIESGSCFGEFEDQIDNFLLKMKRIHFTVLHKYYHNSKCLVQQQEKGNARWQFRQKQDLILRQFKVQESGDCEIGVIQKQQRFFRSLMTYQYSWMRVILVQKQSDGYRWLACSYSNHKTVKVSASLIPGSYVLIILPEWKSKKHDFSLLYRGTIPTHIQRKPYSLYTKIMEQSCMDLAQRFGRIVQISKNICSYHCIQRDAGIVIENINNEKENGNVTVLRSIAALQNIGIYPYNPEFKQEHTIQVRIPCSKHFTVVLLTRGGTNQNVLDMFDFGCPQN